MMRHLTPCISPNGRHLTAIYNDDDHAAILASNTDANGLALQVNGNAEIDGSLTITGAEHGIEGDNGGQLWLGVSNLTDTVVISHDNGGAVRTLGNLRAMGGINGDEGDLDIGTDEDATDNINIGRFGQYIDVASTLRLNSNPIVMDNSAGPTTGAALVFNTNGHGGGGVALDFYTGGTLRGWLDSLGFTNA